MSLLTTAGGGANQLDAGYEISNSVRFDGGSSGNAIGFARFGNNSRDGNTFTISAWIKRGEIGLNTVLFNSKVEDSGTNSFIILIESDDKISVGGQPASGSGAGNHRTVIKTNNVFRDTSAWYHIVYRQDTTQATAANRHILYVNGTATDNGTYAALDQNVAFAYFYNASSYPFAIANDERDNSYGPFYIAEHHYTDGVSNGPDAFGETNDNGVWIPKQYTGSHGSYGHYLKFENSGGGSGTTAIGGHDYTTGSSSTIGADSSGNDNHFHVQGYGTEDQTTDTPTNNFATLNATANFHVGATYQEGGTRFVSDESKYGYAVSTQGVASGKWYAEFKMISKDGEGGNWYMVGVAEGEQRGHRLVLGRDTNYPAANQKGQVGYVGYGTNFIYQNDQYYNGDSSSYSTAAFGDGDIIGVALNVDDYQVTFYKNGTVQNSGTAFELGNFNVFGNSGLPAGSTGFWHFGCGHFDTGNTFTIDCNFGNAPFSISSGNSDANGYGNFEYSVPTNYYALCTKNLAEFG